MEALKRVHRSEFSSLGMAKGYIESCISPSKWSIVMGDNNRFWVLNNRLANQLVKAGYELA